MSGQQKIFKTIDEQIDILLSKGLIIDDIDYVKDTLLREKELKEKEKTDKKPHFYDWLKE